MSTFNHSSVAQEKLKKIKLIQKESPFELFQEPSTKGEKLVVSPNGQRIAFSALIESSVTAEFESINGRNRSSSKYIEKWVVVVDGTVQMTYAKVDVDSPVFSPDSRHVAYGAKISDSGWRIIRNDIIGEGKNYDRIGQPTFSPDSKHLAYVAVRVDYTIKEYFLSLVVDEKQGKEYKNSIVGDITFSPDSKHIAYLVMLMSSKEWFVVLDGTEGTRYDGRIDNIVFSPDGNNMAYSARRGDQIMVIINGIEKVGYAEVSEIVFGPIGSRMAYSAQDSSGKWRVVLDGKAQKEYDEVSSLCFSPDGKRIAYIAKRGNKCFIIVDDIEGKEYKTIVKGSLKFSLDSRRIAYVAQFGDEGWLVVSDENESKIYEGIAENSPIFSSDSEHLAYAAKLNGKWRVVVDGLEGKKAYEKILLGTQASFSDSSAFYAIAIKKGEEAFCLRTEIQSK